MAEVDRAVLERMPVEDRREQRRLARAVRADEPDLLAALDDERRAVEKLLVRRRRAPTSSASSTIRPLRGGSRKSKPSERRFFVSDSISLRASDALLLEPRDLRQLRLRLLRLRLLVAEPLDEALEPGDVDGHAIRGPSGGRGAGDLLLSPLVPRPGEVVRAPGTARAPTS